MKDPQTTKLSSEDPKYVAIATLIASADKTDISDVKDYEVQDLWIRIKDYMR